MPATDGDQVLAIIGGTGKTGKWAIKAAFQRGMKVRARGIAHDSVGGGRKVRVLCRTPDKLKAIYETLWGPACPDDLAYDEVVRSGKLTVVKGSLPVGEVATGRDEQLPLQIDEHLPALRELVAGTSHVMSFLGVDPNNLKPVCRPAIEALMKVCQESKPKILIMSSIIMLDSYPQGRAAWGCCGCVGSLMRWRLLRTLFDDMEAAEAYALENKEAMGLDVTLLRATILGDKSKYFKDYSDETASYYVVKSSELKKVKMFVDRQHVVECFMDAAADKEGKYSSTEWSIFDA